MDDNECIPRRGSGKFQYIVSELIDVRQDLREDLDVLTAMVSQKDVKIDALYTTLVTGREKETSFSGKLENEHVTL